MTTGALHREGHGGRRRCGHRNILRCNIRLKLDLPHRFPCPCLVETADTRRWCDLWQEGAMMGNRYHRCWAGARVVTRLPHFDVSPPWSCHQLGSSASSIRLNPALAMRLKRFHLQKYKAHASRALKNRARFPKRSVRVVAVNQEMGHQ